MGLVERVWLDPMMSSRRQSSLATSSTFPYRHLVSGPGFGPRRDQMLDAIAGLLVELHLSGCFWGDCSLSNLLYRYDAEAIESIMIDAETSRLYDNCPMGRGRRTWRS